MKFILVLLLALSVSACEGDTTVIYPPFGPTDVIAKTPTTPTTNPILNTIEYRIQGNAIGAIIRYSNPIDGLTSVTTGLPYAITFTTAQQNMFLSVEATPMGYPATIFTPFMSVQIFVNSGLFREATSSEYSIRTISVNGTWRK